MEVFVLTSRTVATTGEPSLARAIMVTLLLVVLSITLFLLALWIKKRFFSEPQEFSTQMPIGGFSMGELRRLHEEGHLSTEEFERAKAKLSERARRQAIPTSDLAGSPSATRTKDTDLIDE